ncbi:MAG: hypothetical protein AAF772_16270, partial [Acidobacteriota bacterium]
MLRGTLFIAREDLLQWLRQREVLLWAFVMPVVFFYFIGTVTRATPSPAGSADRLDPLTLVAPAADADDWLVRGLAARLSEDGFDVRIARDVEAAGPARLRLEMLPAADDDAASGDHAPAA